MCKSYRTMTLAHHRTGAGPPLLLIHGVGSQWQMWEPVIPLLARDREVIAIDLPGFGDSPPLPGEPTVEALAAAVAGFATHQGVGRPDVVGNSLGGGIALVLGASNQARTVCALSPIGFARGRERGYGRRVLKLSRASARVIHPFVEQLAWARPLLMSHLVARPRRMTPAQVAGATRNLARCPGFAAIEHASRFRPPELGVPTTIAWGDRDRLLIASRQAPRARRELPEARHVTLHGCGHVPTWDDPEQVAEVIRQAARSPRRHAPAAE